MLTADPTTDSGPRDVRWVPGLASIALEALLTAPLRAGAVLGATRQVVWCSLDDHVVVISTPDSAWLPNAIIVPRRPERLVPGRRVWFGTGTVRAPDATWRIVRWWDAGVRPVETDPATVIGSLEALEWGSRSSVCARLAAALQSGDPDRVVGEAVTMLGAGRGLTPEGDDRLVGAFASFRYVTGSLGLAARAEVLDAVAGRLELAARVRTTSLSLALLRHALAGEVAAPVGDLLRSITGRGDVHTARDACISIGSSSGRALVEGVFCGTAAACEVLR